MQRYFLEVAYKGTRYSGFQVQQHTATIQSEVEKALGVLYRQPFALTGSSRTDAGVHAMQNFFHFDTALVLSKANLYNLNALLPADITAQRLYTVNSDTHCRFHAVSREYKYVVYQQKNPFLQDIGWYYPYRVNMDVAQTCARLLPQYHDFTSFSKRNTQVKTYNCTILASQWAVEDQCFVYRVAANRFLRGMVRGLVATMLKAARGSITVEQFIQVIEQKDCTVADFSAPPQGLFLERVNYPDGLLVPAD